ncbi:MAG TPA: hypothetical protein VL400_00595 [Polyangiaceae bacterium]|jgi:hypothetical protein|nr:hypothetical protein [Polyangiaceae bacterium]
MNTQSSGSSSGKAVARLGLAAAATGLGVSLIWISVTGGAEVATAAPAESASGAAAASAAPSASASAAAPAKPKSKLDEFPSFPDYAWPTTSSTEPTAEEWAKTTVTSRTTPQVRTSTWSDTGITLPCTTSVVREWVRIECAWVQAGKDAHVSISESTDKFFGTLWGVAGDLSAVKAKFLLAKETDGYKAAPKDEFEELTRHMGSAATITFPVQPGTAFVLSLDQMGWEFNYDGGAWVFSGPGMLVDVSWARGEKAPSFALR